ncbi:MAG: phosphoglucomutase/phosphomannomutase family protein, partial [Clostridia bacterium]|nr:phosphoglucomutase/phosphomannomutase family protein [Clostridia bacterium]
IADPMYGAGYDYLGDVLEEVGCRVKVIHGYRDPLFGGGVPDPTREELAELARVVDQEGAHLGVALDGDGDRFGIIDRGGFYLNANQVLALALYHLVKNRGLTGGVARTVATTHMLDRIAEYYGLRLKETPVGFKYIGQALHEQGFLFGGEESGGLSMLGHVPEKDGLLAALLMVEMVAVEKRPLREVWAEITEKFGPSVTKRIDLPMRAQDMPLVKEAVGEYEPAKLAGLPVVQRVVIDGTKLILSDGSWAL